MSPLMACRAAHSVVDVAFSPDGRMLAVRSSLFGETLELFDIGTGARLWKHSGYGSQFGEVTFSGNGRLLAMGGNQGRASVLSADHGRVVRHLRIGWSREADTEACISPDGARLALATETTLRIHDVPSGDLTLEIDHGLSRCYGIAFSPDGTCMATAADDGVYLWDATTGRAGHWLRTPTPVRSLRFSRCGHMLIAADQDHTVRGWDARTGVETSQLAPPADTYAVTFSSDGLLALTRTRHGTLQFWDVTTGREWASPVEIGWCSAAGLDHDRRMVAAGTGRKVKIWDPEPAERATSAGPSPGSCCWCGLGSQDPPHRRQALRKSRARTPIGGTPSAAEPQPIRPLPAKICKATSAIAGPAVPPTSPGRHADKLTAVEPMTRLDRIRSVARAVAFGASGALLGAATCAAVVVLTGEYDTAVTYALLGFIVAAAVAVARPAIRPVWMQALSLVLTLVGLLLSEYVIARHFSGLTDAPLLLPLHDTVTLLHDELTANLVVLLCAGFALLTAATAPAYIEPAISRAPASADDSRASQRIWRWINGRGRWLTATAAAATGLVTLALLTGARLGPTNQNREPNAASLGTAQVPSTTDIAFQQVKAGDCYNDPLGDSVETLPELPCQRPHDAQVFFVFTMPAGKYPGDDAVDASADHTCSDRFTRLADQPTGRLDYEYFTPGRDAWDAGDRATPCALVRADGHKLHQRLRIR